MQNYLKNPMFLISKMTEVVTNLVYYEEEEEEEEEACAEC